MAGPCSVESEAQTLAAANAVKAAGADILRGGAFKPRTSPYSFQGLGLQGLKILDKARRETGLPIVTEVLDPRDVSWVAEFADILQIGTRNMQNFSLLKRAGESYRPILLKRGMAATIDANHMIHPTLNAASMESAFLANAYVPDATMPAPAQSAVFHPRCGTRTPAGRRRKTPR